MSSMECENNVVAYMDVLIICTILFVLIQPLAWIIGFLWGFIWDVLWLRILKPLFEKEEDD